MSGGVYACTTCQRSFAESALPEAARASIVPLVCPACAGPLQRAGREAAPFARVLARAFFFPVGTDAIGPYLLLGTGLYVLGLIPVLGRFLAWTVIATQLSTTIRNTGTGRGDAFEVVEMSDVFSLVAPLARMVAVVLVASAPLIFAIGNAGVLRTGFSLSSVDVGALALVLAAAAFAVVYVPAALIVVAQSGSVLGALVPTGVIRLVARVPAAYATLVAYLVVLAPAQLVVIRGANALVALGAGVWVLPSLGAELARLFLPLVAARMLGLLVRENSDELGLG